MSELSQFINSIPPVTRTITMTSVVMAGLDALKVVSIFEFSPFFEYVWSKWEIYRLLTGFLVPNLQTMQGMMEVYMMYTFSRGVEELKFRKNLPDFIYYHLIVLPIIIILSYVALPPLYSFHPALLSALTYTWSVSNHNQQVNFYFMPIKASLLPAVSLGFRLLADGMAIFCLALIGSLAAYIYNCLETNSWGPLVQVFTGKEPQKDGSSNRLGTVNSLSNAWFYSTGILTAPAWLRTLVFKVTGVDYNVLAYNRSGFTVFPAKSVGSKVKVTGANVTDSQPSFKGTGRRLGSTEE